MLVLHSPQGSNGLQDRHHRGSDWGLNWQKDLMEWRGLKLRRQTYVRRLLQLGWKYKLKSCRHLSNPRTESSAKTKQRRLIKICPSLCYYSISHEERDCSLFMLQIKRLPVRLANGLATVDPPVQ